MARAKKQAETARKTVRNRKYVGMGGLIRRFLADGPDAIQTNRTVASHMFGVEDDQLTESDIRKARSEIDKLVKFGLPLCPCGEAGDLLDEEVAAKEARRGMLRRYRFDPHGSILGEALHEAMGEGSALELAIGAIALGSAVITVGCEEAGALLDAVWRSIPPRAFSEAERVVAARLRASRTTQAAGGTPAR